MKIAIETQISPDVPFVLMEETLNPERNVLLFEAPHQIIEARNPAEVAPAFEAIEKALAEGHHVAGYMNYELGLALEPRLHHRLPENTPLFWFGVFRDKTLTTNQFLKDWLQQHSDEKTEAETLAKLTLTPDADFAAYRDKFDKVKEAIRAGDIYQLNLTFRAAIRNIENPLALYSAMRRNQPVAHAAMVMTGERSILSASPELFIENQDGTLETRPMKGTLRRAPTASEDLSCLAELAADEKSRAENLMIVDLMRNDLGRIADTGTVAVPDLFKVETYRSLHQMISVVRARLRPGLSLMEQMTALFPPGSVTGAPKIRAMELIDDLEESPRGIYTGAIGYFAPNGDYSFNVAIRTISLDADGNGEIGIGSGLVDDSEASAEYEECLLKMQFLKNTLPEFHLLETMAFLPDKGIIYQDHHIERLKQSARYFNYPLDETELKQLLAPFNDQVKTPLRLRLLLSKTGEITITTSMLDTTAEQKEWPVTFAEKPMDPQNPFLHHKTTNRAFYDTARTDIQNERPDIREVLFLNLNGEVTEGSFTNIFIEKDGQLFTPPLHCGLLAGTLRQHLLKTHDLKEKVLKPADLKQADALFVGNSVRGLIRARLVD